jgi:hypothetical protein
MYLLVGQHLFAWQRTPSAEAEKSIVQNDEQDQEPIDFDRARSLMQKRKSGEKLSADDEAFLQRAQREFRRRQQLQQPQQLAARDQTGLKPLNEMTAQDRYQEEDGGLYGAGENEPPAAHRAAAEVELSKIEPLDRAGIPAADGKVVLVSISMSNATQEFSTFKPLADADPEKSKHLIIVDCAQGGQAMAEWAPADARPWQEAQRRLEAAGVTPQQVQVAWIKLANKGPQGDLQEHGQKLKSDTLAVIQNARKRFPNLRIAYLSSRIYAGHAASRLNPEPYAYESAFVVRWLIQDQIAGEESLNYLAKRADAKGGDVKAPLLLWGPYLWADGVLPRKSDELVWLREDLAGDGTHPSDSGRKKVADLLYQFFKNNSLAKSWFLGDGANQSR